MLRMVGIPQPERRIDEYSFQLSGGLRQRVMIAMALSCDPTILIADEPTTALDVTTQAQILDLMRQLQQENELAIILITHDLGVIAEMADDVVVMYLGRVVERGPGGRHLPRPQASLHQGAVAVDPQHHGGAAHQARHHRRLHPAPVSPGRRAARSTRAVRKRCPVSATCGNRTCDAVAPGRDVSCFLYEDVFGEVATHAFRKTLPVSDNGELILEVKELRKYFPIRKGVLRRVVGYVRAVDDVSFTIRRGETLALVGESGCGKTTTSRCILRALAAHRRARSSSRRPRASTWTWPACASPSCAPCAARCR